jgi:DNA-binding CsgD family transcriptional regulator
MIKSDYSMASPAHLPGSLRLVSSSPFVGRSRELAALRTLVPRLVGEGRRIALIGGEAGSGKSRLVREFAQEVAAQGVLVLYGACDAVVRTPFGPFVEALEQLLRATDAEILRADLGSSGGELTRLLPGLRLAVGELPTPIDGDPDTERHRLHTAVADLLAKASGRQPLLLVVEDGHWADLPTLLLLRHLARGAVSARVLVVATFRDTEAEVPLELADTLADLRRSDDIVRLKLAGLSEASIAEFVRASAGGDSVSADAELVASIRELTDGNAYLLCELWRTLRETGSLAVTGGAVRLTRPLSEIATPDSIREVVSQRLSRLEPATRDLLELAAVMGSEFEHSVLRSAAAPDLDLQVPLESAARSGIIEELPSRTLAYRFTHELVRRALYDRLSGLRRAELHRRIAEALERVDQPRTGQLLAGLAHHFAAAAPIGERERAIEYNRLAADAAAAALAFDEAVARLRTALEIGIDDDTLRAETQLTLGTQLYRSGASLDSLAAFREAAGIARGLGNGELFARAAIGFENSCWRPGLEDQGVLALLGEASALLTREDSPLRVRLLAGLMRAHYQLHGDWATGRAVLRSAMDMARRLDDRAGLAAVLVRTYWSDLHRGEVLEMLGEARDLAAELGDIDLQAEAMEWRVATLMAMGDMEAVSQELAIVHEMARRTAQPFMLHVAEHYGSALALLAGHLRDAGAAAERSREWGRLLTGRDASGVYGIQMFGVRREQGRLSELAPVVRVLADRDGAWRPGFVALLAEIGMDDEVRRQLERIRRAGLEGFRRSLWLASLTYLADACSAVGDAEVAALVYPELAPLSGATVMIGHGVACYGAADRYLGMLAATLGDLEAAERHFEAALALNRAMGATTWLAHTAYQYGRMLLAREGRARAKPLLAEAIAIAESVGMPALLGRARALGVWPAEVEAFPDDLSGREAAVLRLVARGLSNREIGAALHISEHTAANHVRSILSKTGSANRTEATAYAYRRGLAST